MTDNIKPLLLTEAEISQSEDFINFKIVIIGDSGVGKSCILKRAVQHKFDENYQATIGFEFLLMHYKVNDLKLKLQIWDTCGQEMYRSLVQGFYRNTSLAILVYDVSSEKSFEGLELWLRDIQQHTEPDLPIFIIGNKCDLDKNVSEENAQNFATSNRAKYYNECSAKSGQNIDKIFYEAAKYLYIAYKDAKNKNRIPSVSRLKLDSDNGVQKKKKKCC